MELGPARNDIEAESAFDASMESFYPETVLPDEFLERMRFKWFRDPSYSPSNIYVVTDGSAIIGGMRLISRTINRLTVSYRMLGIAETFVLPTYRGKGIARDLTQAALRHGRDRNYELLTVVARRAIDGFYLPFGIYGLGSYPKTTFSSLTSSFCRSSGQFAFAEVSEKNIMHDAYQFTYADCFGAIARDGSYWTYLEGRISGDPDVHILGVHKQDACVGYLVHNGNTILELALVAGVCYSGLIVDFHSCLVRKSPSPVSEIFFKAPHSHKLFLEDAGCDATFSHRECFYGGHVLKVLDIESCLEKFNAFSTCSGSREFLIRSGKFVDTQNGLACASPDTSDLDYYQTANLLGISRMLSHQHGIPDALSWSINPLDEF